ncbi:MAG: M23 family metallopeptidase [Frankiaceae bacterium]|nr:M23 family metallopeptidase [Frankiaceae bacterium]
MPAHAASRRPALPALLLTVAAAALGGLALLPDQVVPTRAVLASSPMADADLAYERAAILGRPPIRRTTVAPVVAPKKKAVAVAAVRPVQPRAARKRVLAPAVPVAGYVCPVRGHTSFSDTWGDARSGHRHQGTDVMAAYGAPVVAVISGTVKTAYSSSGGISLYLRGTDGNEYFYAHNSRNVVSTGEHVVTGEVIAYVGTSGNAPNGAPHVHFERHPGGGAAVNPYSWLRRIC